MKNPFSLVNVLPGDSFSKEELTEHITSLFKKTGKECGPDIAAEIYDFVGGDPCSVHTLSHFLWDEVEKKATRKLLQIAQKRLMAINALYFEELFAGLSWGEKILLVALAKKPTGQLYAKEFLMTHDLSLGGAQKAIKNLIEKDLIEKDSDGVYRHVVNLFGKWCVLN